MTKKVFLLVLGREMEYAKKSDASHVCGEESVIRWCYITLN